MVGFFQYIRGYVRIKVWGFSPERFMNLCSNKGILLWDILRENDTYIMNVNLEGFRQLRPIVRKTGTKVAILKRYGLPFLLPGIRKRKLFLAGCIITVAFLVWSTNYIWKIEFVGNYQITTDELMDFLSENHIKEGIKKRNLDIEGLEKEIRRNFKEVIWASARLSGIRLEIAIKENDAPIIEEQVQSEPGKDLVSQYDGVIVSMIVRSGVPKVSIGEKISKGTLLVEGKVPVYNEDTTVRDFIYVNSDADIVLEHQRTFRETLSFDYVKQVYTGRTRKERYIRLGLKKLSFPKASPFLVSDSVMNEYRPVLFEKLSIPFYFGTVIHREYMNYEYEYPIQEVEFYFQTKLLSIMKDLEEKGVQIIEKNVKIDSNKDGWYMEGSFLVHESVGEQRSTERVMTGE